MNIVIAPDSFKESLTAIDVANAIKCGLQASGIQAEYRCLPLADGGEGTVEALLDALDGERISTIVKDPLGRDIEACWGKAADTAIIEMAAASGLELLAESERNPLITDSYGTGQLILSALEQNVSKIILGLGGSATNDGGAGLMRALGARLLDNQGQDIGVGGGALHKLASIDLSNLDPRLNQVRFSVACDVNNPLCGNNGASAVFGPQKGASPAMVEQLDANLQHLASLLQPFATIDLIHEPGLGAAGGLSLGLEVIARVKRDSGFSLISSALDLPSHIGWADIVISGEGKTDLQSLSGKTCFGVANLAKSLDTPMILISGSLNEGYQEFYQHGVIAAFSSTPGPIALQDALQFARQNLENTAAAVGALMALKA